MVRERGLEEYIVDELVKRGWKYVDSSSLEREGLNKPLLHSVLRRKVREFNPSVLEEDLSEAISLLEGRSYGPKGAREVLEYLKFGVPVKLSESRTSAKLKLIDYDNPSRNEFIVSRQVTHVGRREVRNDIVLYINGVPLVNIEVKSPTDPGVSWRDAFLQIERYEDYVPELYKYVQIGVAVEAIAKYFPIIPWSESNTVPVYEWKEENLDSVDSIIEMLRPDRLLDILKFYTYFRMEEGRETKVIARYMQYRTANKIVERVLKRLRGESNVDRGLVWHWQGSGKTLTMIFAAMKLYWLLENPMIFFVVDRVELQNQLYYENLTKLDLGPEVKPKLVDSINRLRQVLSYNEYRGEPGVFVITVQKFQPGEFEQLEKFLSSIAESQSGTIMNRNDAVVFVDEAHRTQYGVLSEQMMNILKNANYFAFTGTPVPRKNPLRNTFAKFSPPGELYLDKYFILDSISDGYTVRIAYQPGPFDYYLDRKLLDDFLESEFDELPEEIRRRIEKRVGKELDIRKLKVFLEDKGRIDKVSRFIAEHFRENVDGRFKAIVVAASRKACVLYKKALDKYLPPKYSEVVITFQSQEKDKLVEEYKRELIERSHVTDPKDAVQKIIEKFRTEEDPRILIVTDMLLTGFDAPELQTMYLDKPLKGHRLLQAIARVNRPYKNVKEYGLIIDFIGIFNELEKAFAMYEKEDLKGAVFDIEEVLMEFKDRLTRLISIIGDRPQIQYQKELYTNLKKKAEELVQDKDLERIFLDEYRIIRKLYELIAPKVPSDWRLKYEWLSEVYNFYIKSLAEETAEEELLEKYYRKTLKAIGNSLQILEKEIEFTPIKIDKKFFEEFIYSKNTSKEEKASTLMFGLAKFRLYTRDDPAYISVAGKIEALLEKWRKKLKSSLELYEEAKKLWEEIYKLRDEKSKLRFGSREYMIYRTLIDAGFHQRHAIEITQKLMKLISDKISLSVWSQNPKLVHEVERVIALTLFMEARRTNVPPNDTKKLVDTLIERIKQYGAKLSE